MSLVSWNWFNYISHYVDEHLIMTIVWTPSDVIGQTGDTRSTRINAAYKEHLSNRFCLWKNVTRLHLTTYNLSQADIMLKLYLPDNIGNTLRKLTFGFTMDCKCLEKIIRFIEPQETLELDLCLVTHTNDGYTKEEAGFELKKAATVKRMNISYLMSSDFLDYMVGNVGDSLQVLEIHNVNFDFYLKKMFEPGSPLTQCLKKLVLMDNSNQVMGHVARSSAILEPLFNIVSLQSLTMRIKDVSKELLINLANKSQLESLNIATVYHNTLPELKCKRLKIVYDFSTCDRALFIASEVEKLILDVDVPIENLRIPTASAMRSLDIRSTLDSPSKLECLQNVISECHHLTQLFVDRVTIEDSRLSKTRVDLLTKLFDVISKRLTLQLVVIRFTHPKTDRNIADLTTALKKGLYHQHLVMDIHFTGLSREAMLVNGRGGSGGKSSSTWPSTPISPSSTPLSPTLSSSAYSQLSYYQSINRHTMHIREGHGGKAVCYLIPNELFKNLISPSN
ncbi:hypothetical protein SAMD00019534_033630 [Acytostelium subglobosum LB1]|uniref:hypothetical protein n=1 Tax=Acytostelium subglobosum LB1 TaxID=1410327 RepID=UPI00064507C2|nr:hypothetical protein SAMD00019534_033630 [Acytostelium subglobosum LB1]GAM20188.1 hypothetical protein SAMD00019534_033630 [Acytostelium subglobosum LB1]|eukprot:XP_012759709.1 hypothetical protein SAMD00019534_033630 [Acytostelium subglobosum LB1]